MACDPASRSVLWYRPPGRGPSVTWRWNGQGWAEVRTTTQPDLISPTIVWDGSRLVMFGRAAIDGVNLSIYLLAIEHGEPWPRRWRRPPSPRPDP